MFLTPGCEPSIKFHSALKNHDGREVYKSKSIKALLEYKWGKLYLHAYIAFIFNLFYMFWIQVSSKAGDALVFAIIYFLQFLYKGIAFPQEAKESMLTFWGGMEILRIIFMVAYVV